MLIKEVETIKPIKPLTPQQARIKSLQAQKDVASKALKAERDRQKIDKARSTMASVSKSALSKS